MLTNQSIRQIIGSIVIGFIMGWSWCNTVRLLKEDENKELHHEERMLPTTNANVAADSTYKKVSEGKKGWKNIPVFVGNDDLYERAITADRTHIRKKWYGQFQQDIAVSSLLNNKRDGFFVDLAANHPTFLSSTYSLEKNFNWTGVCIEPNSDHWWGLSQGRKCQVVGAVIGQKTMDEVKFRVKNIDGVGGHGGIIAHGMKNKNAPASDSKAFYTVMLEEVFRELDVPRQIDYFSLDVEGAEEFIMRAFPFKEYDISLLTIESSSPDFRSFLVGHGFKMVARLGEDTLWAHESIKNELDPTELSKYSESLHKDDPKFD